MNGLTRNGRIELYEGAVALEQVFGRECCAFITNTIPFSIGQVTDQHYSSITDEYNKALLKHLSSKSVTPYYQYVKEVHPKALRDKGEFHVHSHYLILGRARRGTAWAVSTEDATNLWKAAVVKVLGIRAEGVSFAAATQIASVRKSVSRYMSKYMSKASMTSLEDVPDQWKESIPRVWWGRSHSMKRLRDTLTISISGTTASEVLDYLEAHEECPYEYFQYRWIETKPPWYRRTNWADIPDQVASFLAGSYGTLTDWAAKTVRQMFPRSPLYM